MEQERQTDRYFTQMPALSRDQAALVESTHLVTGFISSHALPRVWARCDLRRGSDPSRSLPTRWRELHSQGLVLTHEQFLAEVRTRAQWRTAFRWEDAP
jgi:hypothetical protein